MESFKEYFGQVNWAVTGVATIIISIAVTITGNMLTPKIQYFLAIRFKIRRTKKLEDLKKELEKLLEYEASPTKFYAETQSFSLFFIMSFIGALFVSYLAMDHANARGRTLFSDSLFLLGMIGLIYSVFLGGKISSICSDMISFEDSKESLEQKIKKLTSLEQNSEAPLKSPK